MIQPFNHYIFLYLNGCFFLSRSVHFRIKPNMRNYECEKCGFSALKKSQLAQHVEEEHNGEMFSPDDIGEDGRRLYACDQCSYKATQKGNLNTHKRVVHDQMKQFVCRFVLFYFTILQY